MNVRRWELMNATVSVGDAEQERTGHLPLHLGRLGKLDAANTEQIIPVGRDLLAMLK